MQPLLPNRLAKSVNLVTLSVTKPFRTLLLASGLLIVFSVQANAQTEPEVIQDWANLEEADFLFDVYYRIVKCSPESEPEIHLIAFNEGGNVDALGFTLHLYDDFNVEVWQEVERFEIGFAKTLRASCENDENAFLKFPLSTRLDLESLKIDIKYNK